MKKLCAVLLVGIAICLSGCANSTAPSSAAAVAQSTADQTVQTQTGSVEYYFPRAGQQPAPVLIGIINSAKTSIDMAIYSFTDTNISGALISAKNRGVTVRVITDNECSTDSSQKKLLNTLKKAGIPIKINAHLGLMHLKVTIADNSVVTTGSFNYTKAAETENDEVFVVLRDSKAAQDFEAQFVRMWNDNVGFADY